MMRQIVGGVLLSGLLASGAAAQIPFASGEAPFSENFTFLSGGIGQGNYSGEFTTGTIGTTGENAGSPFQVWCVDPNDFVHNGEQTTAYVTPLNSSNFGDTYVKTQVDYEEAAYLVLLMADGPVNGGNTTGNTDANPGNDNVQCAIWDVMGYGTTFCKSFYGSSNVNMTVIGDLVTKADQDYGSINPADWGIITPTATNCSSNCRGQEFLYQVSSAPLPQVTPEPGTLSLLAMGMMGMAGAMSRRKRRTS